MRRKHLTQSMIKNPMFLFMLVLIIGQAMGFQSWRTMFNNFAVDEVGVNGFQVGVIQAVREIPGFLAFTVIFFIMVMKESLFSALMVLFLGVGVGIVGLFPSFEGLIFTTVIMSVAFHFFETTNQSLTLQSFPTYEAPVVIAWYKSVAAIVNIITGGLIFLLAFVLPLKYQFMVFGGLIVIMIIWLLLRGKTPMPGVPQKKKIVLKKKYWLFYVLNFLSGARRQIFVVFAVFMLVKKYEYSVQIITILFIVNNLIAWQLSPFVGKWINKYGERKMLTIEYASLFFIFMGYALIENQTVVTILYVLDHVFFAFAISINTYFQKTADKEDIAPSMATGFTINHIMAVVIPVIGGMLWMYNWRIPFFAGAVIALASLYFAQKVKLPDGTTSR